MNKTIVIIPARGGSKGVPNKNILEVNHKPLIYYTIERALESELISEIIVSTDSEKIIQKIKPFHKKITVHKRSSKLATDDSPIIETIIDIIETYKNQMGLNENTNVLLLQPTSPLRLKGEIDEIILLFDRSFAKSLISVVLSEDVHPARMYQLSNEDFLEAYDYQNQHLRRQDLKELYFRDGCYYLTRVKEIEKEKSFFTSPSLAFKRDSELLLNIDSKRDFIISHVIMEEYYDY